MYALKFKESETYIMFCNRCGNQLQQTQRFCPKCGNPNENFNPNVSAAPQQQYYAAPAVAPATGLLGAYGITNKMLIAAGQILLFLFQIIFWFCETLQITMSYDGEKESAGLSIKEWFLEEDVGLETSAFTTLSVIVLVVLMILAVVRLLKPVIAAYVPVVNSLPVNGTLFVATIVFELWYLAWNGLFFIYMIMTADDLSVFGLKCTAGPTFAGVLAFIVFVATIVTAIMLKASDIKEKKAAKAAAQYNQF